MSFQLPDLCNVIQPNLFSIHSIVEEEGRKPELCLRTKWLRGTQAVVRLDYVMPTRGKSLLEIFTDFGMKLQ